MVERRITGPVSDPGRGTIATQAEQETGTAIYRLVTSGRQHFHASAVKVWGVVNRSAGTPTLQSPSYNISGVTDDGSGNTIVSVGTDFSDADYSVGAAGRSTNNVCSPHTIGVGAFDVEVRNTETSLLDTGSFSCWALGDQA